MRKFITVSSQGGFSKTLVNVDSLNRVSYHLSKSAQNVVETFSDHQVSGLFSDDDFYSVLDVNGSNINSLDSINEIDDKLNNLEGIGHGMTYVPNDLVKANEEVFSSPDLLASYLDGLADFVSEDKVYCGTSKNVSLYWTEEMVSSVLSLYKVYAEQIPNDYSHELAFFIDSYPSNKVEFIKGKIYKGIPLVNAQRLRVGTDSGMVLSTLSSFNLRYLQAKRCISPSKVHKEGKGGIVGISDYTSVLITSSSFEIVVDAWIFLRYLLSIVKQALGLDYVSQFLEDLFDMFCTVEHKGIFSYLDEFTAAEYTILKDKSSSSLIDSNVVKGNYVYVPVVKSLGGM